MASGVARRVFGGFIGTGSALNITTVGFRPRSVQLRNASTRLELYWQEGMADASAFKKVAAGTSTVITTAGITPLANGFTVGTDAVNSTGELVHYEAQE